MLLELLGGIKVTVDVTDNEVHILSSKINYVSKPDASLRNMAHKIRDLGYSGRIDGIVHATNILRGLDPQSAENLSYLYSYYLIKNTFNKDKSLLFKIFNTGLESKMNHYGKIFEPTQTIYRIDPLIKAEFMGSGQGYIDMFKDFKDE